MVQFLVLNIINKKILKEMLLNVVVFRNSAQLFYLQLY